MTKDDLREAVEMTVVSYFDTYCGAAFVLNSKGLLEALRDFAQDHETMTAVMQGFLAGFARAEKLHKESPAVHRSPAHAAPQEEEPI